jgi:hypothetical protein
VKIVETKLFTAYFRFDFWRVPAVFEPVFHAQRHLHVSDHNVDGDFSVCAGVESRM